jgi:lipid-A-disaccharide synthase-like uncharacterized protein
VGTLLQQLVEQSLQPVELLGYLGQCVFFLRFFFQWLSSEKRQESVIPEVFWWLSIGGGAITLVYAVWKVAPAIILAQTCAGVIYVRNLALVRRSKRRLALLAETAGSGESPR